MKEVISKNLLAIIFADIFLGDSLVLNILRIPVAGS